MYRVSDLANLAKKVSAKVSSNAWQTTDTNRACFTLLKLKLKSKFVKRHKTTRKVQNTEALQFTTGFEIYSKQMCLESATKNRALRLWSDFNRNIRIGAYVDAVYTKDSIVSAHRSFSLGNLAGILRSGQGHREEGDKGNMPPQNLPRWIFFVWTVRNLWHSIKFSAYF